MRQIVLCSLLLLLVGCSSIKPPIEPQAKLDADTYYNQGMKWEALQQYTNAGESYDSSLSLYSSMGEARGVAASICAQARIALAAGDVERFEDLKNKAAQYISDVDPALTYQIVLLDVYSANFAMDYAKVSEVSRCEESFPLDAKLQIASAKLQADTHLGIASAQLASDVEGMSSKYRKMLKKKAGNSELYSQSLYSLAYYQFGGKRYSDALTYLKKSNKIDYEYGNLIALGHGLWLQGQVEYAQGRTEEALSSLIRAEGILSEFNEPEALIKIRESIAKIKGKS